MKYDPDQETYELSTGRTFDANCGLLSPGEDGCLYDGYDGKVYEDFDKEPDEGCEPFTTQERHEIAGYMIAKWEGWARK